MRCLIVDDERPAREELIFLLEDFDGLEVVGEAKNGLEAISLEKKLRPDLIFLDIQMPKINGIEVAEVLMANKEHNPLIVFVTAYDAFAIKAFEVNAVDYLLKPILKQRLEQTINKLQKHTTDKSSGYEEKIEKLICEIQSKEQPSQHKVCCYKNERLIPLNMDDIVYATVANRQTVVWANGETYIYPNTLSHLEEKLDEVAFFRSHRSFLINLNDIEVIEPWFNHTYQVKMKGSEERIPVSRNQVKVFKMKMDII